jgi:hypothetical protein
LTMTLWVGEIAIFISRVLWCSVLFLNY